jgi:uncharacterized membrane protein
LAVLLFLSQIYIVNAQSFVQYRVQIEEDGSAVWSILHASTLTDTIDTWQGFQQRVFNLIEAASSRTMRQMDLDPDSLQMNTVWENQSQTTAYQFTWVNFSLVQEDQIIFGDVFRVEGFFSELYGEGELQFSFPSTLKVLSALPQPNGINTSPQTLDYLGTQFFVNGNPSITLGSASPPTSSPDQTNTNGDWPLYVAVGTSALAAAAALTSLLFLKRRKKLGSQGAQQEPTVPSTLLIESEEEKVLRIIRANGGTAFQSAITEQLRFSKAKTSQLLTSLEKKGVVRRYKKGRDKIVTLAEKNRSDSS